jgi:hypothetical protein
MVDGGLVEPARDSLFLLKRFRVEPSGDLGLDLRTVRPAISRISSMSFLSRRASCRNR